jgi:hypothetical protein
MRKLLPIGIFVGVIFAIFIDLLAPGAPGQDARLTLEELFGKDDVTISGKDVTGRYVTISGKDDVTIKDVTGRDVTIHPHQHEHAIDTDSPWTPVLFVQIAVTLIFVASSLFVVLSKKYAPAERHWAYGALGTILGFWLHTT